MIFRKPKRRNQYTPIAEDIKTIKLAQYGNSQFYGIDGLRVCFRGIDEKYEYEVQFSSEQLKLIDMARQLFENGDAEGRKYKSLEMMIVNGKLEFRAHHIIL